MKILMAASEAVPFAKTGGLADVLGSLPAALNKEGADVRVIMPRYGTILPSLQEKIIHKQTIYVRVGWRNQYCGIEVSEYDGVIFYFIDNEYYFERDSLYGYPDDTERFGFYCRAVLEALPHLDFVPDVIHCHDWQTGMIPVLLEAQYRHLNYYKDISTVFTIHNLKYQGNFSVSLLKDLFDLDNSYFAPDKLEFFGDVSFIKGGLAYSHKLTTVSPTYAEEIKIPYYGEGLDGLLLARSQSLSGILNGIDCDEYNPKNDPFIYNHYSAYSLEEKVKNKLEVQKELNIAVREDVPCIALITRLVSQKGLDLLATVLDDLLKEDLQLWVLGTGDIAYEELFINAENRYPGKVSANIRFDNVLAHRIYAGADMFLMPSQFEPCGLGQIISLRYGTLPIVRETGGLKDTVVPFNETTGEGNGFSFTNYNANDMLYTIKRALRLYKAKDTWATIQRRAMESDLSWSYSARLYMDLYESLKG